MKTALLLVNTLLIASAVCHADVGRLPMPDEHLAGHQAKPVNIRPKRPSDNGRPEKTETAGIKADRRHHVNIVRTPLQTTEIGNEPAVKIKTTVQQAAKRLPVMMNKMVSLLHHAVALCARTIVTMHDRGINDA